MVFLTVNRSCASFRSEIIPIDDGMCWSLLPNMQKLLLMGAHSVCSCLQSRYLVFCWYMLHTMELLKHAEMVLRWVELCYISISLEA